MTSPNRIRGAAPVGFVSELGAVEANAVRYLRRWSEGPDEQVQMWGELAGVLGPEDGRQALRAFDDLCALCARYGRRPLMRHSLACKCLGADESCFANFIGAASDGDIEDAALIATILVRSDMARTLAGLAETFGLALKRMALKQRGRDVPEAHPAVLH